MANETDRSNIAGALETMVASAIATIPGTSQMVPWVNYIDTGGGVDSENPIGTMQWYVRARSAGASAATEGTGPSSTEINLIAVTAQPSTFPITINCSLRALNSGGRRFQVAIGQTAGEAIARGIDEAIAELYDDFAENVGTAGSALTWAEIRQARAKLRTTGYLGEIVCVLHPGQIADLFGDAVDNQRTPVTNDEFQNSDGRIFRAMGMTFVENCDITPDGNDDATGLMYFRKNAIGVAVDLGPGMTELIRVESDFAPSTLRKSFTFYAELAVTTLYNDALSGISSTDEAAIGIISDVSGYEKA